MSIGCNRRAYGELERESRDMGSTKSYVNGVDTRGDLVNEAVASVSSVSESGRSNAVGRNNEVIGSTTMGEFLSKVGEGVEG